MPQIEIGILDIQKEDLAFIEKSRIMRAGHRQAQNMFLELGHHCGFETRRTYSRGLPTDGIWINRDGVFGNLVVAAIEVVVSESPKTIRGSVATLETVSPSVGVILLHEDEIRRGMVRNGDDADVVHHRLRNSLEQLSDLVGSSRQRLEVWSFRQLFRHHALLTSRSPCARGRVM